MLYPQERDRGAPGALDGSGFDDQLLRVLMQALAPPTSRRGETPMRLCFVASRTTLDDVQMRLDAMA